MPKASQFDDAALAREWERRELARKSTAARCQRIREELFDKQLAFMDDPAREKAALCTRRAGKTSLWTRYTTIKCLQTKDALIRIWAITRLRAKQLLWKEFQQLFARHDIRVAEPGTRQTAEVVMNETELTIRFVATGSEIRLLGADKDKEVEKKRGDRTDMEVVVEAQLFAAYLRKLVEDVAGPCLFDRQGTFCLEGTPGLICGGFWWDVSGGEDVQRRWVSKGRTYKKSEDEKETVGAGWSVHRWSVLDNPFLPHAREELAALFKKRNWTETSATYVREWLGRWVNDLTAMFYRFDPLRNVADAAVKPWGPGWEHVLGWDLGSRDDMAIVVWAYHPERRELYEAFSWKKPGALGPEIAGIIEKLEKSGVDGTPFNIVAKVADTGGGGRMFVEEFSSRFSISFEPAKKTEKYEHVRFFNDDLKGGFIKFLDGSVYVEEISLLPRDVEHAEENPGALPREHEGFPNHCCDAGLYAYRRAFHYLHEDKPHPPKKGTSDWFAQEVARMEQEVLEQVARRLQAADDPMPYCEDYDS